MAMFRVRGWFVWISCCDVRNSLMSYEVVLLHTGQLKGLVSVSILSLQVKQLRNRADEDARLVHMSLQMDSELPSSLRKDLDHLMILVSIIHTYIYQHSFHRF